MSVSCSHLSRDRQWDMLITLEMVSWWSLGWWWWADRSSAWRLSLLQLTLSRDPLWNLLQIMFEGAPFPRLTVTLHSAITCPIHTAVWMRGSILRLHLCVKVSKAAVKFCSGTATPVEVVSLVQYWRTIPVWTKRLMSCIKGVSVWQSDNYTGPSPNKIKCPKCNVTGPNNSNVVTVTVFGNLYEGKNTTVICIFLCELHSASSLRQRCLALCEQTTAEIYSSYSNVCYLIHIHRMTWSNTLCSVWYHAMATVYSNVISLT